MALRLVSSLFLICTVTSCSQDRGDGRQTRQSGHPAGPSASKVADAGAPDTVGCGAIPKHQFEAPESLIAEWVHRDSLGLFMSPDDRLFELMACPGHLGGGDEVVVGVNPTFERLTDRADSAVFLIVYKRYGVVHADTSDETVFESRPGVDTIRVTAIRTAFGWRFPFDVANPHLSPRVTLHSFERAWNPSSRDSLEALTRRP